MIGWVDGSAGASGDMLLGALVGAGVDLDVISEQVDRLGLGIALRTEAVQRGGCAATRVHVEVADTVTTRHLVDIVAMFDVLDAEVRNRSTAVFERLARAEAAVHGTTVDEVHFHEVGALDSIADIVGVCTGFVQLGLDRLHCSTLSLGSGQTSGAHGPIPIPGPAVLALLTDVAPAQSGRQTFEATTPTGAALLAEWVDVWGPMPAMAPAAVGVGAGATESDVVMNATRLVLSQVSAGRDVVIELVANVDDLDPRLWPVAIDAALAAGALDAWVTPIIMKKGRPAHSFSAMCAPADRDAVSASMFANTSTIGLREREVERTVLDRHDIEVDVDGQRIRVKIASHAGTVMNRSAEWDDVVQAAEMLGRPAADVLRDAIVAACVADSQR